MKLKKSDIGAEILSILTKGMYADPRDALREYVQNAVDAEAKNIQIKIRHNLIVIEDDGIGMNYDKMRNAIRLGVSDKNPKDNVGFMGIGIYSAFHLCDQLDIYSNTKDGTPQKLTFNFHNMRHLIEQQKENQFDYHYNEKELTALQNLLEDNIKLESLDYDEYPKIGTRVEMSDIEPDFFNTLDKFDEVAEYLERVMPLPFNPNFKWGGEIQNKINDVCSKRNLQFKLVNVFLQINDQQAQLYRPYHDNDFDSFPLEPVFLEVKFKKEYFGIAWGCLNESRKIINNDRTRGFILKKQGFTIGERSDLIKFFKRATFFNRYVGEIIVTHPKLLPNAPRSEFEFSPLRTMFYNSLGQIGENYNEIGNKHQEITKFNEQLNGAIDFFKKSKAKLNLIILNSDKLLDELFIAQDWKNKLGDKKKLVLFRNEKNIDYDQVMEQLNGYINEIRNILETKEKNKRTKRKSEQTLFEEIEKMPKRINVPTEFIFNSLNEVIDSFGFEISDEIRSIFQLIDEQYFQSMMFKTKKEYKSILSSLRKNIEEMLED